MDIMLFILYYSTLVFMTITYFHLRKKGSFTISDGVVLVITLVVTLGGYFSSYGYRTGQNELNFRVFMDYYLFLILVPVGLIIGNRIKIKNEIISLLDIQVKKRKIKIIVVFMIFYGMAYLYFIKDSVPLFLLLTGKVDYGSLAVSRIAITHNFQSNFNIPFILRYYRLFIHELMRFVLSIVFLMYIDNKRKNKTLFFIVLASAILFHIYNFEKSGLIYVTLVLFFSFITYKNISFKNNKTLFFKTGLISIVLLIVMYMVFMGVDNWVEALNRLLSRAILGQSGGIYFQDTILYSKYNGILWGKGVPMFLIDSVLNRNVVDLSGEAYAVLFPNYVKMGAIGTTGGMPMFFLRSNFGYLIGASFLFIISIVTGIIDRILLKGIESSENKRIVTSLYSVLIIYFIQAFMSNLTRVFMLPFILSPQIIIIILTIIFLKLGSRNRSYVKKG